MMSTPVFRFAPSPNGRLHLGHAASALLNARLAAETGGRFLLRIEDIDITRCRPEFESAMLDDLAWLGLSWEEPVLRQSTRFACYREALERLDGAGLLYPCFCTRKDLGVRAANQDRDPDGVPLYDGRCRDLPLHEARARMSGGEPFAQRLHMTRAIAAAGGGPLVWREGPPGTQLAQTVANPSLWGDAVLRRKEFPASYHLAVVVDDAFQNVTHVVRGLDLFHATALHRLLQKLLGFSPPAYLHHGLILGADGEKLAKSRGSPALEDLRASGLTAADIRAMAILG
jgi:glutamyl-Q tRNA(Asp) synthetase